MLELPIFCYHKVGSEAEEGRWLNIDPITLESHVRFFSRRGFRFVNPGQLEVWPIERSVSFTFDDAYASALTHAVPIFCRYAATATFYAVASKVGLASDWDGDRARPLASLDALHEAVAAGFEVGNHTATHPRLAELSLDEATTEVVDGRTLFEDMGLPFGSLCYPYGSVNEAAVRTAGYPVAVALGKRPARATDSRLALPRIVVAYSDALPKLLYKMKIRPLLP